MLSSRIFLNKNSYKILKSVSCRTLWKETKYFSCSSQHFNNDYLSFRKRLQWESLNDVDHTNPHVYRNQLRRGRNPVVLSGKSTGNFHFYTGSGIHMPLAHLLLSDSGCKRSYFFNMPEGMLKNYLNTWKKVPNCNSLFLTKLTWENVGGLCSVILNSIMPIISAGSTLPDGQISIYGPVGTAAYIRKMLTSQFSKENCNMLWPNFVFTEVGDGTLIEDDPFLTLKVRELKPASDCLTGTLPQPTLIYEFDKEVETFRSINENMKEDDQTMASTGKEEYPESYHYQVAIVDCPTVDHAKTLFDNNYFTFPHDTNTRRIIVHQSNRQVLQNHIYQEWIGRNEHCTHISAANENAITHMPPITAFYRGVCNKASSLFFPLHGQYNFFDHFQEKTEKGEEFNSDQSCTVFLRKKEDRFSLPKFYTVVNNISPQVKTLNSNVESILPKAEAVYPKLVVLGSGSASLSPRSQSAYLLQLKEDTSLLIDCGLGTLEQLYNHFNPQQLDEVLSSIKVIFISHKHLDHMGGLGSLLQHIIDVRKERAPTKKVIIVALSRVTKTFVGSLYDESILYNNFEFLDILPTNRWQSMHYFAPVEKLLGVEWFLPVMVDHGPITHGLILNVGEWKMVYSADTLAMSKKLIHYGRDADLLIHESTYASHAENLKAKMRMHSYKGGALATAREMNAQNVILTHFGSSFPLVPLLDISPPENFKGNIFCAMDHLEFSFSQMHLLPNIHENLMHVFKHSSDRYAKRTGRDQRREIKNKDRLMRTFQMVVDS